MKPEQDVATINVSSPSEDVRVTTARLVREGIAAAKAGDLTLARQTLQQAVSLDKNHETALMWLASISDKPIDLLGYLQQVLAINPANERAAQWSKSTKAMLAKSLIQQGAASQKEGMPEIAMQYFLQATEYEPTNETAWLWLVSVSSEPEDKLSYLNRILQLNPTHEKALALFHRTKTAVARSLVAKANAAVAANDVETAREILRDVMDYNPNLEEAWLLRASLAATATEKTAFFEKALEINPESEGAHVGLLALRVQQQQEEQALHATNDLTVEEPSFDEEASDPVGYSSAQPTSAALPTDFTNKINEVRVGDEQFVGERYVEVKNVDDSSIEAELRADAQPAAPQPAVVEAVSQADFEQFEESIETAQVGASFDSQVFSDERVACRFCQVENSIDSPRCNDCGAFVSLSNYEALLKNELHDEANMRDFIERLQADLNGREPSAEESFTLALAYLNLRNFKKAVGHLETVLRLDIDNEKQSQQITALLDYLKDQMPEMMGGTGGTSGKTIMVVDDSPTVRKLIVNKLEKLGHAVVAAVDGMDALSKINETLPDLILLDVTMPRLDGYQLCKLIRANAKTKHVPVVMISGKDGFFDKVRGRMAGSTAYITKPFGPETLLQTVESYCK